MSKIFRIVFLTVLAALAVNAGAADLDSAKAQRLVGERADGFLGLVVESAPDDVRQLVADINNKRRAEYARIAKANGLTIEQVQALAGKKAIEKTAEGEMILTNGGWEQK